MSRNPCDLRLSILLGVAIQSEESKDALTTQRLLDTHQWYVAVWFLVGLPTLVMAAMLAAGEISFHWIHAVCLLLLFPDTIVRLFLIPLGWIRATYYVSLLANFTWTLRPRTGALCAALLARMRQRRRADLGSLGRFLDRRLSAKKGVLVSTHLLAEALVAELRDEHDKTRVLMETILRYPLEARGRRDESLARQWLLLDAARSGDWSRIPAVHGRWSRWTRLGSFLNAVGRAFQSGEGSRAGLVLRWIVAPRPWATRPLLRRALAALERTRESTEPKPADDTETVEDPWLHALRLTAGRAPARRVADAWQAALHDQALHEELEQRARDASMDPADLRLALRESVSETLTELADAEGLSLELHDTPGLLESNQADRLRRLEETADALAHRTEEKQALEPRQELAAWVALQRRYQETLRSGIGLHLAFRQVDEALWNWAAWLYNECGQKSLAQAVFHWLHDHAVVLGDEIMAHQMSQNMKHEV